MNNDLYKVRLMSFGWGLLSLVAIAIVGVFASPDFALLVKTHFGDSVITGFLLLLVPEIGKHIRNLSALKKLGADSSREKVLLI